MKKILISISLAVSTSPLFAQNAFEGFYGQIATGYESNQVSNLNSTGTFIEDPQGINNNTGSNQKFGGTPLVLSLGYNFSITSDWLLGIGVDYSAFSQKSSTFNQTVTSVIPVGRSDLGLTENGNQLTVSNRINIFLNPGYVIDKDKLVYFKAGYSAVRLKQSMPSSFTTVDGFTDSENFSSQTKTLSGYIVGLGYKQMIGDGFYGFAEANYMSYSKATFNSSEPLSGNTFTFSNSPSLSSYQALFGIGYKF